MCTHLFLGFSLERQFLFHDATQRRREMVLRMTRIFFFWDIQQIYEQIKSARVF